MRDAVLMLVVLSFHIVLYGIYAGLFYHRRYPYSRAHLFWPVLIPLTGPVCAMAMLIRRYDPTLEESALARNEQEYHTMIHDKTEVVEIVPLEEALLINDPIRRRRLMLNILRKDPESYLDVLLIARFNEDTETAHYATATIMELQRNLQLDIQRCQTELSKRVGDLELWHEYIELITRYVQSGLLEGRILFRQRQVLKNALKQVMQVSVEPYFLREWIRNSLALGEYGEAKVAAERLIQIDRTDELGWLESMRVCVNSRDQKGLQILLAQIKSEMIDWTQEGREQVRYWTEAGQ